MPDLLLHYYCKGLELTFETQKGLFSPEHVDYGTQAMLSHVEFASGARVLDLGCGYGAVGILAAKFTGAENVVMTDIDPAAVEIARRNAVRNGVDGVQVVCSDGFRDLQEAGFDMILSNPPYQTDFAVARHFIEKGFNRLKIGGHMWMVTKRREWYFRKLQTIFGGAKVYETDGYYVFDAEKRSTQYAGAKATRKQRR